MNEIVLLAWYSDYAHASLCLKLCEVKIHDFYDQGKHFESSEDAVWRSAIVVKMCGGR